MISMLEQETETIIQALSERTIGSARSLALKDALAADIPRSIRLYLQCEVTRLLRDDLNNATHFSNFRFTTPLVRHLTNTYIHTLAPEYIFTREEFAATVENAVHFVENYLCRPQWTLAQFAFVKRERATLIELQNTFEYLSEYLYYGKLVEGFIRQRGWQDIAVGDFRSLLTKIDDQVVRQHDPRELAQLTRPIFEFLLMRSEIAGKAIPIKPLIVFFEDKKMDALKEYVERICQIRNSTHMSIEQLADIIEDMYSGTPGKSRLDEKTSETLKMPVEELASLETPRDVERSADRVEPLSPIDTAQRSAPVPASDKRNIALSLTFSGMTESSQSPPSSSPPSDLKTAIDQQQRERFIRTIFQNDAAYYNVVLETLKGISSWNDASLYLQAFYQTSGLDPNLPDVVEFTDIIQLRYSVLRKT